MRPHNVEVDAAAGVQSFTVPAGARYVASSHCRARNTVVVHTLLDAETNAVESWRLLVLREDELSHIEAPGSWQFGCRWDSPMMSGQAYVEPAAKPAKKRAADSLLTPPS